MKEHTGEGNEEASSSHIKLEWQDHVHWAVTRLDHIDDSNKTAINQI